MHDADGQHSAALVAAQSVGLHTVLLRNHRADPVFVVRHIRSSPQPAGVGIAGQQENHARTETGRVAELAGTADALGSKVGSADTARHLQVAMSSAAVLAAADSRSYMCVVDWKVCDLPNELQTEEAA